ncbi:MAG: HAD family hydrolase [Eubacteriales bacterium]|nr:HAD family hydrolase [Eubacteriales bacterium]
MKKKAIFLDIDGTLTVPGQNVPPDSALEAIRKARAAGNYVFLCSGRNYSMLKPLLKYPFDGFIASSGGYVAVGDKVIYDCPMPKEQSETVTELLKNNNIFKTVECRDGSYTDEEFKEFLKKTASADGTGNSELLRWRQQVEKSLDIRPMSEYKGQPVYKFVVMAPNEDDLLETARVLAEELNVQIMGSVQGAYINGEIIGKDFDKGTAVRCVCSYLDIPIGDSVGFGDSMNDREMLETVGISVCMENGTEAMKEISDVICPAVDKDGLYAGFEKCGLF